MSGFQQKITRHIKSKKPQFEETGKASVPCPNMAEILELAYQEYKTAMINMLRAVIEKVDRIQEQMSNVSRQMDTLRKNEKEMVEIKNTMTEMKDVGQFFALQGCPTGIV